mgnify:CR=1 FL=1
MANSKGQPYPLPDDIQPLKFTLDVRSKEGVKLNTLVDAQPFQMVMQYQTKSKQTTSSTTVPKAELIRNRFELQLDGVKLHDPTSSKSSGRPFTTRARVKFPGFWDAVSIYQWAKKEDWLQADFESWADQHFFRVAFEVSSSEYSWLVSASQAKLRSHYTEVLSEFDGLLSKERVIEEELQTFLNSHPEILVPGFKRVIPKLALGAHITDFVIEDATSNYLLVELESPSQPLFIKTGHRSSSLTHAVGQVEDWIRYIQDNKATVERELGLPGISATPHALVVIGRGNTLNSAQRRKLQMDQSRIEVLTYDDIRTRFSKTIENLMGMLGHAGDNHDFAYDLKRS